MQAIFGYSAHKDTEKAFSECCRGIPEGTPSCVFLWLNPGYDLDFLAESIRAKGWSKVLAATTGGILDQGRYRTRGMSLTALYSNELEVETWLVDDLQQPEESLQTISRRVERRYQNKPFGREMFATLLVDGLASREEEITNQLYPLLGQVPLIGGSAGDGLNFQKTFVYFDGQFRRNSAVVALFETSTPFRIFKFQHHQPTSSKLVVTGTVSGERVVTGLNGRSAGVALSQVTGIPLDELSPEALSANSLALKIGDELYVRAVHTLDADHSLKTFCAMEQGSVLTLVRSHQPAETLAQQFDQLESDLGSLSFVLSFDCILRRLEFERRGCVSEIEQQLQRVPTTGFCTYGEQYNALHVNQTMVGVAFANAN